MQTTSNLKSCTSCNVALNPISSKDKVFAWYNHASLWFSLGVGLLVIQVGTYLVPSIGLKSALYAVILGSILGAGLLAFVAKISCDTGLSSAGLMYHNYGTIFAKLPIMLNILQLLGWTTFELVVIRDSSSAVISQFTNLNASSFLAIFLITVFWGLILLLLQAVSMLTLIRQIISKVSLPLIILSLLWLTYQFGMQFDSNNWHSFTNQTTKSISIFSALDLVIAMPVSWLPLIADYARHGKNGRGTFVGVGLGYCLANIWCYILGIIIISVVGLDTNMITALLLAQGGLIALSFIVIDELDNAYGDLYSASISSNSLMPNFKIKHLGMLLAGISTIFALVLPIHSLEPFLLLLSSVFIPLFGVILGRNSFYSLNTNNIPKKIELAPAGIWVLGIIFYHVIPYLALDIGSAIPTLAVTFIGGLVSSFITNLR